MKFDESIKKELQREIPVPSVVEDSIQEAYQKIARHEVSMKKTRRKEAEEKACGQKGHDQKHADPAFSSAVKRRRKKSRKAVWISMAAAACLVFVLTGVFYTNPSLAKELPLIGNLFEQFEKEAEQDPVHKDKTAYKEIAEHAEKITAPGKTATDTGITITASDAYYDGYNMFFTLALTAEGEEYGDADGFNMLWYEEGDAIPFAAEPVVNGISAPSRYPLQLKKNEDGTFICFVQVGYLPEFVEGYTEDNSEAEVSIECNALGIHLANDTTVYNSFTEEMKASKVIEGTWNLTFQVSVDPSDNESVELEAENNGFVVTKAIKTPSNFIIGIITPAEWISSNPAFQLFDADGNRIYLLMEMESTILDDGRMYQEWLAERTDATEFTLKAIDKNSSTEELIQIAEIPFSF